jgi:protein-S-isoprenylcysteine O-methyltransferase Ste14
MSMHRSAGVWVPPPLIYIAGYVAGLGLERLAPLPIGFDPVRKTIAVVLMLACAFLWTDGFVEFRRHHATLSTVHPVKALVTSGVFRFSRNPLYLGSTLLYAGLALNRDTWWPLIVLVPIMIVIDVAVVRREEAYLASAFGEQYVAYKQQVRRWL